jgi:ribosomal protein L29
MTLNASDLRAKSSEELLNQLKDNRKSLKDKSKEVLNQKEKNLKIPRSLRKDIARILHVLREKEILANSES